MSQEDGDKQCQQHAQTEQAPLVDSSLGEPIEIYAGEVLVRTMPLGLFAQFSRLAAERLLMSPTGSSDASPDASDSDDSGLERVGAWATDSEQRSNDSTLESLTKTHPSDASSLTCPRKRPCPVTGNIFKRNMNTIRTPSVEEYYGSAESSLAYSLLPADHRHCGLSTKGTKWPSLWFGIAKTQSALEQKLFGRLALPLGSRVLDGRAKDAKQIMQRADRQNDNKAQSNDYDASDGQALSGQKRQDDGTKQTVYQMPASPHSSVDQLDDVDISPRRKVRLSAYVRSLLNEGGRTLRRVEGKIERQVIRRSIIPQSLPKTTEAVQRKPLDDFDQVAADLIIERARKRESQCIGLGDEERLEAEEKLQRHKSSKRHGETAMGAIAKARRSRTRFDID